MWPWKNKKNPEIGGYIGGFGLSSWWRDCFDEDERAVIISAYRPMGFPLSGASPLVDGPLKHTAEGPAHFISSLPGYLSAPEQRTLAYRCIAKAEALTTNGTPVITRHFIFHQKIKTYYRWREIDDFALNKAVEACRQQIDLSSEAAKCFRDQWAETPGHLGFKQLAIIQEKSSDLDAAIETCEAAKRDGWNGDWEKRICRLRGKKARRG